MSVTREIICQNFVRYGKKIFASCTNYRSRAAEFGQLELPDKPVIFLKPTTAYVSQGNPIKIPQDCEELEHEVELGVIVGKNGQNVCESEAMSFVAGFTVALDLTARHHHMTAIKCGLPWLLAKGFDTSCPVGYFIPKEKIPDPYNINLRCLVNGEVRQNGNTSDMVLHIPVLLSYISIYFHLEAGDLILTGTPSGVGKLKRGDKIEAFLDDLDKISFIVE